MSAELTVFRFDRKATPPGYQPVAANDLVCDGCGATVATDEPGRGLYRDEAADGTPCVKCRCGTTYYSTATDARLGAGTLALIAAYITELKPREDPADGTLFGKGFTLGGSGRLEWRVVNIPGWREQAAWGDSGFRLVWVNDSEWAILSYTEGDIYLTLHPDQASYARELRRADEFYRGVTDLAGNAI